MNRLIFGQNLHIQSEGSIDKGSILEQRCLFPIFTFGLVIENCSYKMKDRVDLEVFCL